MSNQWKDANDYYWGKDWTVWVLKARKSDPVKFYAELHYKDSYWGSMGSNLPFVWMVVLQTIIKRNRL